MAGHRASVAAHRGRVRNAADREVIERALREIPQAKPVREDEPYYATPGAFLDKIFQHQLALPPLRSRALTKFAHDLVDDQGGIWKELRDHGQDTFDRAVFALVPVHVRSPRRVKVLLNNFATNARIAQSRSIGWLDRAHEVAVLTVLQTEFPAVADDLRRVPRLLVYLRDEEEPASEEVSDVVARYRLHDATEKLRQGDDERGEGEPTETAAGQLLSDDDTATGTREREVASATLRRHLSNYLAKVAAAGIRDPRRDLLYLQAAGGRETLTDPRLGDAIDFATDTAPDAVVETFADETSATLAAAIPLLVTEGDNETGPGRAFAYEAACRVVERLDPNDHATVTQQVGPSLIAAATARTLTPASLPGALLVACWADATDVVREVLENLAEEDPSENLLDSLTVALPHLGDDERKLLVTMLADQFNVLQKPLPTALHDAPVDSAIDLWRSVEDRVLEVLNDLELPEPESEPASATTRTAVQAATPAAPAKPQPTGVGVSRLEEIVETVQQRGDHEPLLSAVLATAQSSKAAESLRTWVGTNADRLVGTMSSPVRHAWHALLGLEQYPRGQRGTWSTLLPEHGAVDTTTDPEDAADEAVEAEATDLATKLLLSTLVPAFGSADDSELRTLPALVSKVASWASASEDDLASSVSEALEAIGWSGGSEDSDGGQMLWDRKEGLFEIAAVLSSAEEAPLYNPFVEDLASMLTAIGLTDFATANWKKLCQQLPKAAAEELSNKVDEYQPSETEPAAVLGLRLAVRAVFGGDALAGAELAQLTPDQQTTALTGAWLALVPHPDEVRGVLAALPFAPTSLRRYCDTLDADQRTIIWLTLASDAAADGHLARAADLPVSARAVSRGIPSSGR